MKICPSLPELSCVQTNKRRWNSTPAPTMVVPAPEKSGWGRAVLAITWVEWTSVINQSACGSWCEALRPAHIQHRSCRCRRVCVADWRDNGWSCIATILCTAGCFLRRQVVRCMCGRAMQRPCWRLCHTSKHRDVWWRLIYSLAASHVLSA